MDYSIVSAGAEKEPWREAQRVGSIWKNVGLQDAPRKRSMDRKDGDLWRRTKFHIIYGYIYQLVVEVKWEKTRPIIKKWFQRGASEEPLY